MVVEKRDIFLIKYMIAFVKLIATIAIVLLTAVGIISLLYEQPRVELLKIALEIKQQVFSMLGI